MIDKSKNLNEIIAEETRRKAERDFSDTRYNWLRTQTARRTLVALTFFALLIYGLSMQFDLVFVTVPALITFFGLFWLIRISVRRALDYPKIFVDERILKLRGDTYHHAFCGVIGLISFYHILSLLSR